LGIKHRDQHGVRILTVLGYGYAGVMSGSGICFIASRLTHRDELARTCLGLLVVCFVAVPFTAMAHVWLSPRVTAKRKWTRRFSVGLDAYTEAFRYLLRGGRNGP
jgi:hypothetical protein